MRRRYDGLSVDRRGCLQWVGLVALGLLQACESEVAAEDDSTAQVAVGSRDGPQPPAAQDAGALLDVATSPAVDVATRPGVSDARPGDVDGDSGDAGSAEGESPALLAIRSVQFGNDGCRNENTTFALTPDRSGVAVDFGAFSVSPREDFPWTDSVCNVRLNIDVPVGQQFAIESFSASGTATLGEGARAELTALTAFTGVSADLDKETRKKIVGPYDGPVSIVEKRSPEALSWSRCGDVRSLNVTLTIFGDSLGAGSPAKAARVKLDHFGSVTFAVRPCPLHEAKGG